MDTNSSCVISATVVGRMLPMTHPAKISHARSSTSLTFTSAIACNILCRDGFNIPANSCWFVLVAISANCVASSSARHGWNRSRCVRRKLRNESLSSKRFLRRDPPSAKASAFTMPPQRTSEIWSISLAKCTSDHKKPFKTLAMR